MNEITKIKNEIKLKQWSEMIRQRNESGLTVAQWCTENGVNQKTYYYRLKRLRKALCSDEEKHEIVAVEPDADSYFPHGQIMLTVGNIVVNLPNDFDADTMKRLLGVLQ